MAQGGSVWLFHSPGKAGLAVRLEETQIKPCLWIEYDVWFYLLEFLQYPDGVRHAFQDAYVDVSVSYHI